MLTLVVIGLFSYVRLPVDLMPKIDFPFVSVVTVYPGAGPEEIETLITKPIEDAVSATAGLKNIQSYCQEGVSVVLVEFELETNVDFASMDVKDKVDAIRMQLPQDVEPSTISKFDVGAFPIMNLAVSSKRPLQETYEIADRIIKLELARVQGLAAINIIGGRKREITVLAGKDKLKGYGLSIMDLVAAIAAENLNIPGGHIIEETKEYGVRVQGEFTNLDEIRNVRIQRHSGPPVRLRDVAAVEDAFEEVREVARYNGEETVGITLQKRSDANTVKAASQVFQVIERLKRRLPPDVRIEIARDGSRFIRESVADVNSNMILGIILTALVLFLFLHSWQGMIIAGVAMPVSIISTFTLLYFAGFTVNVMTLMGLAICVGILVTNALVVIENIYRFIHKGKSAREAAEEGTAEIAVAVLASTLTNVVVFVPIAFMRGIIGQFFKEFGLTVTFATFVSLLVSFTLTPMLASKLLSPKSLKTAGFGLAFMEKFFKKWDSTYESVAQGYRTALSWALDHRWRVVGICFGLFALSLALVPLIGAEFFGQSDQGLITVTLEMPVGANLAETQKAIEQVETIVTSVPETDVIFTSVGSTESDIGAGTGVNLGDVLVRLVDIKERKRTDKQVAEAFRNMLTDIPSARITVNTASTMGGGGQKDLEIEITGPDMPVLVTLSDKVSNIVAENQGTVDVDTSWRIGKPEIKLTPMREKAADRGVSTAALASVTRTFLTGTVASRYRERDEEYDIRVMLAEADRNNVEKVGSLLISTENGAVSVSELARVQYDEGPTQIIRKNRQRMVTVSANIARGTLGGVVGQVNRQIADMDVPQGYQVRFAGMAEIMAESFGSLFQALILAIILTYMLLAAILESYVHPFTVMLTLPLGAVGAFLALFLSGKTISIFSLMAIIMLVGIVVNNAILLLDYTRILRKRGLGLREALLEACPTRFRPIVMTNVTTAVAMLPLALGFGAISEFRAPMAIVSIGGLLVSAVFTLFLIPVVYSLMDRLARLGGGQE